MKAQWYSSLTSVMLLSLSLCITEIVTNSASFSEGKKEEPKICVTTSDNGFDVLNPIYIFK
jgi:hypothetical protein